MKTLVYTSTLGIVCLIAEIFNLRKFIIPAVLLGLVAIFGLNAQDYHHNETFYNNMIAVDSFSVVFSGLFIVLTFLLVLLSAHFYRAESAKISDYMAILVFILCGAIAMVSFHNLAMFFLGIEVLSISLYILAGSNRKDVRSNEAGMKYFLMGSFASGILLFGIALVYGASGSFDLGKIYEYSASGNFDSIFRVGVAMIMIALFFKVSAVPFHFWAPDVYEGAPTLITAVMSSIAKIAGFAAFCRLFSASFSTAMPSLAWIFSIVAALTITVGNFTALNQDSFKRMLAFSGISHAGYMLLAILSLYGKTDNALFFYSAAYGIGLIGAFAVAILVADATKSEKIDSFNGLGKKNPLMAAALTMSLLSLAGIPPFAGFFGKYYIFSDAIRTGHLGLTILAVINSIVAIYYYFKVILAMYTKEADDKAVSTNPAYTLVIALCFALSLLMGIFPSFLAGVF